MKNGIQLIPEGLLLLNLVVLFINYFFLDHTSLLEGL